MNRLPYVNGLALIFWLATLVLVTRSGSDILVLSGFPNWWRVLCEWEADCLLLYWVSEVERGRWGGNGFISIGLCLWALHASSFWVTLLVVWLWLD